MNFLWLYSKAHNYILKLFPGITRQVVKGILEIPSIKGVVLETYGSGNASTNSGFIELLKEAILRGIYIVNVTQCISGSVIFGQYETSVQLKEIGIINGNDITTESAVAKLMYMLGENISRNEFKTIFENPLRGEMS